MRLLAVDSVKNIFQTTGAGVGGTTVSVFPLASGDIPTNATLANQGGSNPKVEQGAKILGFDIQCSIFTNAASAAVRHYVIFVRRNKGGYLPVPVVADGLALGAKQWKTQIFYMEQAQGGQYNAGLPMVVHIRFKVPRAFQRMEVGDIWELVVIPIDSLAGELYDACTYAVYKWYR